MSLLKVVQVVFDILEVLLCMQTAIYLSYKHSAECILYCAALDSTSRLAQLPTWWQGI